MQCAVCSVQCGESLQCDSHPPSHALCWENTNKCSQEIHIGVKEVKTSTLSVVTKKASALCGSFLLV